MTSSGCIFMFIGKKKCRKNIELFQANLLEEERCNIKAPAVNQDAGDVSNLFMTIQPFKFFPLTPRQIDLDVVREQLDLIGAEKQIARMDRFHEIQINQVRRVRTKKFASSTGLKSR